MPKEWSTLPSSLFPSAQDLTPALWAHHPNEHPDGNFCVQPCFGRKPLRQDAEEQLFIWFLLRSMPHAQCPRAARSPCGPGMVGGRASQDTQRMAQPLVSLPGVLAEDPSDLVKDRRSLEGCSQAPGDTAGPAYLVTQAPKLWWASLSPHPLFLSFRTDVLWMK